MGKPPLHIPGPLGVRPSRRWFSVLLGRWLYPLLLVFGELLPRLFDLLLSLAALLLLSPLLLWRGFRSRGETGRLFTPMELIGRFRSPFYRLEFAGSGRFRRLAVLFNILRGDLAFVGPRALSPEEARMVPVEDLVRFAVRPGLVSAFRLRRRVGIAYERESAVDREHVYAQSFGGDMGLAARSLVTSALGGRGGGESPPLLNFFGVPIVNTSMAEAVDWILARARGELPGRLAFVNPDCLNIAYGNPDYKAVLWRADLVLPDGIGIHLGCRMLGQSLRANVNGTDLFPLLCEAAANAGLSLYLLGARPGIAAATAHNMQQRFPALRIAGTRDGYFRAEEEESVLAEINASGAAVLLVAFGVPRQEFWIDRLRSSLAPRVCMGVGGLFDYYSGRIPRAPQWLREMGLEWVWRLKQEPGRMWRRYVIGNPLFLFRVWRQARQPERFPLPPGREKRVADQTNADAGQGEAT